MYYVLASIILYTNPKCTKNDIVTNSLTSIPYIPEPQNFFKSLEIDELADAKNAYCKHFSDSTNQRSTNKFGIAIVEDPKCIKGYKEKINPIKE